MAAGAMRGGGAGRVSPARAAAFAALLRLEGGGRLDDSLAGLPELEGLDERDRALANELVVGVVKRRLTLDALADGVARAPLRRSPPALRVAVRLGAYQLLFLDRVPAYAAVAESVALARAREPRGAAFVNAVLRRLAREGAARLAELTAGDDDRAWSLRWGLPAWMVGVLRRDLGDEAAAGFAAAALAVPERCLRLNRLRATPEEAAAALAAAGGRLTPVPGLLDAVVWEGPPLERSGPVAGGLAVPQSRGSQVVSHVVAGGLVRPDAAVIDLCAAPGLKTAHLRALLPAARLTAVERDPARAALLRETLARLGADDVEVVEADAREVARERPGAYDAALLDAPCSGLGALGTRPDLRHRRRPGDLARHAAAQRELLAAAAACVRPGGTLTYAVCTVSREETLDVVRPFAAAGGWAYDDLSLAWPRLAHPAAGGCLLLVPPRDGSTGFFIARLRRDVAG